MKVILKQDIDKLGKVGEVVEVSDGFGRNFLIPQGKAISYTKGNLKQAEYLKKKEMDKKERELNEAKNFAEKLNNLSLEIKVKAGEQDKLYGSVTSKDISDVLASEYGLELDKKKIDLKEPLKKLGVYDLPVNLYKDVVARLRVKVIAESPLEAGTKEE